MPLSGKKMLKKHPEYSSYLVCSDGRVWSQNADRFLIPQKDKDGYLCVGLRQENKPRTRKIHQLVLETFAGERRKTQGTRHLDGNKENNNLSNLRWGTHKENMLDERRIVKNDKGRILRSKLCVADVLEIRKLYPVTCTAKEIATRYGITRTHVYEIKSGKSWGWL
ncbi:hypothetical protein LCGC14_2040350 [marine sediment metagenome]|uniref:HNH nuclease domain-containing protein n=1 Tax=marine sediment metagenome TaxID=412755 RepID=A0A0F9BIM4_9ZZZZ